MSWEGYTERARRAVVLAREEANNMGCEYVGTEHLLFGILSEGDSLAARACAQAGITLATVRETVRELGGYAGSPRYFGSVVLTPRSKKVVEMAQEEAAARGERYAGTEHLFIAIYKEGEGIGSRAFQQLGFGEILRL